MPITQEIKVTEKQWDVKTITVPATPYSFWGIKPALIPRFVQLYGKEAIDDVKEGQEYLNLSFNKLKKLVAFLHSKGYDTTNLSKAVEQAINDAVAEKNKKESAGSERETDHRSERLPQEELYRQLQTKLVFFSTVNPKLRLQTDGIWGPASQQVLDYVLQLYHLPPQEPSEALVEQLQAIALREVRIGCTDVSLVAAIKSNLFCILDNRDSKYKMEPKGNGAVLLRPFDAKPLIEFSRADDGYLNGEQYNLFSAWLMLLNLQTEKPYGDFCDLWIKEQEDADWQPIEQPSLQKQRAFVSYPDSLLSYNTRSDFALFAKFIARTNFDIEILAVYFSGSLQFRIMRGDEMEEAPEVGRQFFFFCDNFFEELNEEQKALANPLLKADFIKLFVVRKNLVFSSDRTKSVQTSDNITDHFYHLIAAPPEALLATVTIGLSFEKNQISLEEFKKTIEKRYANNPITVRDDLQKDRWGGQSNDNGFQLNATVTKALIPGFFSVEATVHSTDLIRKEQLTGHVAFFLHDTFPNEIEYVVAENGVATLKLALCYEAFTLAAYTENGTELELDLNEVPGYPKGFYWRDHSTFQDRVIELYKHKPATVKDDLQKGRWGGKNNIKGKILSASVDASWIPSFFDVRLKVLFTEPKSLEGEVAFFLHDSFTRQIRFAPINDGVAELKIKAYEAFTVGAYTEDGTELELDLETQQGYPQGFYYSDKERGSDGPLPFTNKWLLVAGTGRGKLSYEEKVMSETLSQLLAKEGFGLICGGWFGVDKVVSESFADFFRTKQIPYKGRLIQLIEAGQNPSYEVGELRVLDKDEDWYQEALKQTYALIMIGGKGGTYLAYERASNIGIPVLPIPQTGGDALRAFNEIVESSDSSISPVQIIKLNQPIKSIDDAEIISGYILNILNQLTKENRTNSPTDFKSTVKELYKSTPIIIEKDPQKNRWGGMPVRNGKRLMASVKKSSKWYYDITIDLITEAGSPLHGDVAFFLHSSFKDPIRFTRASESRAQIRVRASNAFVIGAYTEDGTILELDLQTVEGYPKDFYYKENGTGEFQFYTEEEICGLVGSLITSVKEFVTGYLLIFQTRKQKTWLVATSKSLFVLLDDEETRKDNKSIMTSFQKKNTLPLKFQSSQKLESSFLVKFSAEETWWYCTKELFQEPNMLTESVQKLVKNLSPEQLTSLEFQLTIESADSTLKSNIRQGLEDERENEQSTQAGVPRIPYEIENFTSVMQPLVKYLGNLTDDFSTRSGLETPHGFVVLVALDEVYNCILSFGEIWGQNAWSGKSDKRNLSAGFLTHEFHSRSGKLSCPTAGGSIKKKGRSSYSIGWDLDSVTFANSTDRKNKNLSPTTTLPETLQMIILSSIEQLPFLENDFSQTSAVNLWTSTNSKNILKKSSQFNATVSLSVNREVGSGYVYKLSEVFFEELYDEFGKPYELKCTKFLFDKQ